MKEFLLGLIRILLNALTKKETTTEEPIIEPIVEPILKPVEETKEEEVVNIPVEEKQPVEPIKEVYKMLSLNERMTYFKKIGLYVKKVDGVWGNGAKEATRIFNCVFLGKNNNTYYEETDRLLRIVYGHYVKSPYINDEFMKLIKNFRKSELKCKCVARGFNNCNGYPHEISIKLLIALQYIRFRTGKSVGINSGVRCVTHNKRVGGVNKSPHLYGRAADFYCSGFTAEQLRKIAYETPRSGLVSYAYNITKTAEHITVLL